MLKIIKTLCILGFLSLSACASVTDKIPTVKIERKKPKVIKTTQANYTAPKVQKAEAALVCENDNMRARSTDRNLKNDTARVLVLEEGGRSSNIIADVEVNCRDYFESTKIHTGQTLPASTITHYDPKTVYVSQHPQTVARTQSPNPVIRAVAPLQQLQQPTVIKTSSAVQAADGYYYSIKKGDTLYRIAKDNCSSVMDISALNGIYDPTKIEVHQIIRLPAKKCNARN